MIIGITEEKLILNRSTFSKTATGLERISDTYFCRTEDFSFFAALLNNGKNRKAVQDYLQDNTETFGQYEEMLIEFVEYDNTMAGFSKFIVTYVGKISKISTDAPTVSTIPLGRTQYIHTPYAYSVDWVEYIGRPGSSEETAFILKYQVGNLAPPSINGFNFANTTIAPYGLRFDLWSARFVPSLNLLAFGPPVLADVVYQPNASLLWAAPGYVAAQRLDTVTLENIFPDYSVILYSGFKITSFSFTRNGNFASASMSFQDSASTSVFQQGRSVSSASIPRSIP